MMPGMAHRSRALCRVAKKEEDIKEWCQLSSEMHASYAKRHFFEKSECDETVTFL
jgi:hypothetical protein